MNNRVFKSIFCLLFFSITLFANNTEPTKKSRKERKEVRSKIPSYSKEVVQGRLDEYQGIIDVRYNREVRNEIRAYTQSARKATEILIGKSSMYFQMIDDSLQKYNLPRELKYMVIIESRCDIKVKSPAGAVGLWQFMPATARKYGLKIDNYVDERCDPYKATSAAMKYLSDLYARFGDWTLAIASYNCGEGRMQDAMRKAKSRDFWKVRKELPKETQLYIPKFIAATYMMDNYLFYDLHPAYPDYDVQLTKTVIVYERKSFKQIAEDTGYSVELIKSLNPAYKRGIIPPSAEGRQLILPRLG
jgi:peptidoglycan lytic transglycosylase D